MVKNLPVNAGDIRDMGSIPGLGRSPGEGYGNPLQYSCLENPTNTRGWWATVHSVAKSQTRLKQLSTHAHTLRLPCPQMPEFPLPPVTLLFILRSPHLAREERGMREDISAFSPPPERMRDYSQPSVLSFALNWEILLPKEANQDQARQDEGQPT